MNKKLALVLFLNVVFFNAFVDVGHKIIIQNILFISSTPRNLTILSAVINAFILLPYVFMFMPSGYIADRFSKTKVLQWTALAAVPLTVLITLFYYHGLFWAAFTITLLLGIQSALNSPAKYAFIKEQFGQSELMQVNGVMQAVVIVAILSASLVFSLLFRHWFPSNVSLLAKADIIRVIAPLGFFLVLASMVEVVLTRFLPAHLPQGEVQKFNGRSFFCFQKEREYLQLAYQNKIIWPAIVALSAFWAVGQVLLANYGSFLKTHVPGVAVSEVNGMIALASVGIFLGALVAGRVNKNYIEKGLNQLGAVGLAVTLFFIPHVTSMHIIPVLFVAFGYFGGLLIVPLNAVIQYHSKDNELGKILAANNFIQNIAMLLFLLMAVCFAELNVSTTAMLYGLFVIALLGCGYALVRLPQSLARYVVYMLFSKFYRVHISGCNLIPAQGGALLLGNHTSFLDWAMIQIASPRPVRFVMERSIYQKWYLRFFLKRMGMIPINGAHSKDAISQVALALSQGDVVALFPEGFITRNGQLGQFKQGYERIIAEQPAPIVPFYIHGLWGTATSYSKKHATKSNPGLQRRVRISFGAPINKAIEAAELKRTVMALGYQVWADFAREMPSIQALWVKRAKSSGRRSLIQESTGRSVGGYQAMALVAMLKKKFSQIGDTQTHVGVMLPPSIGAILSNLAWLAMSKTVINLNYSASKDSFAHMLAKAEIKTIVTSRVFLTRLFQRASITEQDLKDTHLVYLEDLFASFSKVSIAHKTFWAMLCPLPLWKLCHIKNSQSTDTAFVLFSSGSEGLPKGVELTHAQIISNIKQVTYAMNIEPSDKVLSCLPLFHAMGLTMTTFLPMLEGVPVVCHPDPVNGLAVAKAIARFGVTLICNTPTLYHMYARNKRIHPLMMRSLRLVIAGAEKLPDTVRQSFKERFNLEISEGYGTTENAPIVSCNLPDLLIVDDWHVQLSCAPHSVGLPVPGTQIKIIDPKTEQELPLKEAGLVLTRGPQLMRGYLNDPEKNKQVFQNIDSQRWYKTGDKGYLDEEGFLYIIDRYARFVKIAGEMVSLASVEAQLAGLLSSESSCVALGFPDDKKGECVVVLHDEEGLDLAAIKKAQTVKSVPPLMMPSQYIYVAQLPRLGSGKIDLCQAKKLAQTLLI